MINTVFLEYLGLGALFIFGLCLEMAEQTESFELQAQAKAEEYGVSTVPQRKLTCTPCFDALWFCYSPVHQVQQYYRYGVLDNCSGKWSNLVDCLTLKTKRSSELQEILETREKESNHIWSFRTPEEAAANWSQTFGHLDEME